MPTDTATPPKAPITLSKDMECAMVGAIMQAPEKLARIVAMVRPEDIEYQPARLVYESIKFLGADNQPIDPILIRGDLAQRGKLDDVGGSLGLTRMVDSAPTGENAEYYAARVADAARERRQRAAVENAYLAIQGGEAPATVIAEMQSDLEAAQAAGGHKLEARSVCEILAEWKASEPMPPAIATCYTDLDILHGGGLAPGGLTVVGAAPSVGKSQLVHNLEARMRRNNTRARVLHVSMEMDEGTIIPRFIAMLGQLRLTSAATMYANRNKRYTMENYGWAFDSGLQALEKLPIQIIYGGFDSDDLKALAARYSGRFDVMVVDYLQLVSGDRGQKTLDRVAAASRACKQIALEHNAHVIAVSSLNRDGYRNDARPTLASLRETGNIEFDADNVWLLWREKAMGVNEETMELSVVKQRNGPLDMITFNFELTTGIITENRKRDD